MAVKSSSAPAGGAYHHGSLKAVLIEAARRMLERDGIAALSLRGAAREAGVSHAAPKHHFGDLTGLLSELAATGFVQLREEMLARAAPCRSGEARLHAIGGVYVRFARSNPDLFLLMFRRERLDMDRPALRQAATGLLDLLAGSVGGETESKSAWRERDALEMTKAWSQVHGLAMLLIDGRLGAILSRLPGVSEEAFVARLLEVPD
jgi:AcrR family transcriptional regulator